jgi:hypothetical protein
MPPATNPRERAMTRMIMAVFSDAVSADREDEYNDWYSNIHVQDVCAIPGVKSFRRFKSSQIKSAFSGEVAGGNRYLVLYEIETDDPQEVENQMRERLTDGRLRPTDTLKLDPAPVAIYYEEI